LKRQDKAQGRAKCFHEREVSRRLNSYFQRWCFAVRNSMAKPPGKKAGRARQVSSKITRKDARNFLPAIGRDWLWGLVIFFAVILAYQPIWWAGFIWDDFTVITSNPCIVGPFGLKQIWTTSAADICPLTLTTFWLEHALWGLWPLPYHLVNVFLHGACAVALWRVLRSLRIPGAWLGAALWALHPVQVDSVAWITEMKNTQSALFFLLAVLFFVKKRGNGGSDKRSGFDWPYALTLLCSALALASKSSAVMLPLVLCLCAWWMEGRWQWRNLIELVPVFLMSAAAGLVSVWTQKLNGADAPEWSLSFPQRLVSAGEAIWFYAGKLIWPYPLSAVYPRWQINAASALAYLPLLAAILLAGFLWFKRESGSRPYLFAWAYFLLALLPVLGFVANTYSRYSLVADHFQYLASMGPLALAGAGMVKAGELFIPTHSWLQSRLGAGLLLVLGILSWQRAWVYQDEQTLWTDVLAKNPDGWAGHYNLGVYLLQRGRLNEAIADLEKAAELNPNDAVVHTNLGRAFGQLGRSDDAIRESQKAVEINPHYAEAYNNLGNVLAQKGLTDEAILQYKQALEIIPNYAIAHNNLGNSLAQKGRLDEAIAQFQAALQTNPGYANAHKNLGNALLQKGRLAEAIAQFQEVVRLNPDDAAAQSRLAQAEALAGHGAGSK
jgi:tetratricopeptide (TPR) repeat protein